MKCHSIAAAGLLAFLNTTVVALANGAVSEFPAGGVIFKHEKNISIAREDLDIGYDRIHVHYVFVSSAPKALKRTIGFPLAKVPQDDSPDGFQDADKNYMAFKVTVNGKPLQPKLHEYAWVGDTNITDKLHRLGVPVFAATAAMFKTLARLPKATVSALKRDKLVEEEEHGAWLVPQWLYQSVYEWRQTFAPGRTEVDVTYAPRFGAGNDYDYYYPGGKGAPAYCLGDAVKQEFAKLKAEGKVGPEPYTVGYILKTANNWRGPIGDFHLTISDKDSFSSFCVPKELKAAGDGRWQAKDFVPKVDLKVVFYYQEPKQ
jgi:hypothetical protein